MLELLTQGHSPCDKDNLKKLDEDNQGITYLGRA